MENYFYLSANFDMQIIAPKHCLEATVKKNEQLCIVCDEDEFCLSCFAHKPKTFIAPELLCVKILNGQVLCTNTNVSIFKITKQHYKIEIKFQKMLFYAPQRLLKSSNINEATLNFFDGTIQCIVIRHKEQTNNCFLNEIITDVEFKSIGPYYALLGKRQEKQYILMFNVMGQKLFEGWDDEIEISGNEIISLKHIKDIASHGFVCKHELKNGQISLTSSYSVYLNNTPFHATNKHVLGIAFLEALNINNIKLARYYLDDELNKILDDNQLVKYFGDYLEFEPNFLTDANNSIIFYYTNNLTKIYYFITKNNKIVDIVCD